VREHGRRGEDEGVHQRATPAGEGEVGVPPVLGVGMRNEDGSVQDGQDRFNHCDSPGVHTCMAYQKKKKKIHSGNGDRQQGLMLRWRQRHGID